MADVTVRWPSEGFMITFLQATSPPRVPPAYDPHAQNQQGVPIGIKFFTTKSRTPTVPLANVRHSGQKVFVTIRRNRIGAHCPRLSFPSGVIKRP